MVNGDTTVEAERDVHRQPHRPRGRDPRGRPGPGHHHERRHTVNGPGSLRGPGDGQGRPPHDHARQAGGGPGGDRPPVRHHHPPHLSGAPRAATDQADVLDDLGLERRRVAPHPLPASARVTSSTTAGPTSSSGTSTSAPPTSSRSTGTRPIPTSSSTSTATASSATTSPPASRTPLTTFTLLLRGAAAATTPCTSRGTRTRIGLGVRTERFIYDIVDEHRRRAQDDERRRAPDRPRPAPSPSGDGNVVDASLTTAAHARPRQPLGARLARPAARTVTTPTTAWLTTRPGATRARRPST